jgi:hypothetical protein
MPQIIIQSNEAFNAVPCDTFIEQILPLLLIEN